MGGILFQAGVVIFLVVMLEVFFKIIITKERKQRYLAGAAAMVTAAALVVALAAPNGWSDNTADDAAGLAGQGDQAQEVLTGSTKAYNDGVKAFEDGKYAEAIDLFGQVYPEDPNYADAQAKLQKAKEEYAKLLLAEGKAKLSAGKYEEAVRIFDLVLNINPDLAEGKKQKELARRKINDMLEGRAASREAENAAPARNRMKEWDFGSGPVGIAVKQVKFTTTVNTAYGFDYVVGGDGNGRYVWLYVSAVNHGQSAVRVDPDDFTLSTADGYRVTRNEATFSQSYFKDVSLAPGGTNEGWIIFYMPKKTQYVLGYYSGDTRVEKAIVF